MIFLGTLPIIIAVIAICLKMSEGHTGNYDATLYDRKNFKFIKKKKKTTLTNCINNIESL